MPSPLTTPMDPWETVFEFFSCNPLGIVPEDLDKQAEELARKGINHIIISGCHFRWSFYRYWDLTVENMAKLVEIFHKHGIRVTEHHSVTLTLNPQNENDEKYVEGLRHYDSAVVSWEKLRDDCYADFDVDGVPISSLRQINGRTGKLCHTRYHGYVMCSNNLNYRKTLFNYLKKLYAIGIDGMMTDDVQIFCGLDACACPVCRKLFREKTGYEMPEPGESWASWHGNYDDPSFVAWLDFRFRSIEDFHEAVKDHYESLGLRPLRPNYCSDQFNRNLTAYSLETLPHLDWISIECCGAQFIRYYWPFWAVESAHRFAVGRRRGIPAGVIVYPTRKDTTIFTWGMTRSWGMLWQPMKGPPIDEEDMKMVNNVRSFEIKHHQLYRKPQNISSLGFYDSRTNRELYGKAEERSLKQILAWMQACYRSNILFDVFQKEELPDRLNRYRVVVLNEVAMISEEELQAFKSFVKNGGTLVWTGLTGTKDLRGISREEGFLSKFWGIDKFKCAPDGSSPTTYSFGKGTLVTVPVDLCTEGVFERTYWLRRDQTRDERIPFGIDTQAMRKSYKKVTDLLVGLQQNKPDLRVENLPDDVIVTAFELPDTDAVAVHILNAAGTFDLSPDTIVGHADTIPFPSIDGSEPIRISLRKDNLQRRQQFQNAKYRDPNKSASVQLDLKDSDNVITIELPPNLIKEYGIIELR